jgi:hypothetical protein
MSSATGRIGWIDMTVEDAPRIRDFYKQVVGWGHDDVPMGDYPDFSMTAADGEAVAGICHARGSNAELPGGWLIYITVGDIDASVAACEAQGGELVVPVREMGGARFCVIRDPAGATAALYQP